MPVLTRRPRRLVDLSTVGGLVVLVVASLGYIATAPPAPASSSPPAFNASASASGAFLSTFVPGVPLRPDLLGAGAPTAQATQQTYGTSAGYAAFPDPGVTFVSLPGTIAGLLAAGAGGLPPVDLPPLPSYPFYVQSSAANPHVSLGDGPYVLTADQADNETKASATGGLVVDAAGSAALIRADAKVSVDADGAVVAEGESLLQGLSIGPITFGEVRSVARETMDASGTVTPSTDLHIDGVRIGGLPVSITGTAIEVAGVPVPLPIGSTLQDVVRGAGYDIKILGEQRFDDRVIAPAIEITGPLNIPDISTQPGTYTLRIGGATAQLATGAAASAPPTTGPAPAASNPLTASPAPGVGAIPAGAVTPAPLSGATGSSAPPASSRAETTSPRTPTLANAVGLFDIRSLYLIVALFGAVAVGVGQIVRLLGVRGPWNSFVG